MQYNFPNKLYNVIYADPPWKYKNKMPQDGGRECLELGRYYDTMDTEDIMKIPVKKICHKDCACFLWVTDSHLHDGLQVLKSWGFTYKTIAFVWVKKTKNGKEAVTTAPWTLKSTEICLLGTRGGMTKYKAANNVRALTEAEKTIHSRKPDEIRKKIMQLFGGIPKIELFAREYVEGWDSWGNQLP